MIKEPCLSDPDTSDLLEPGDAGVQTEPSFDLAGYLADRETWLAQRQANALEHCPF